MAQVIPCVGGASAEMATAPREVVSSAFATLGRKEQRGAASDHCPE
jgi:hypothetical protein